MSDAEAAAAEERRRRAQARKDKIAGRGADRLAKITGAAKGEGENGVERYGTGPSSSMSSSSSARKETAAASPQSQSHTLPALAAPSFNPLDDPPDIDISQSQAPNGMPEMPDMLSALLGGQNGSGSDAFASMFGGGGIPGQQQQAFAVQPARRRTWTDRLLPLMHLLSMVSLALYAVAVIEPHVREGNSALSAYSSTSSSGLGNIDWYGWAALGRGKQGGVDTVFSEKAEHLWQQGLGRGVAGVQLIYMFLVLELGLQSAAIFLFKTSPPIPSLLNSVMPYLPPNLAMYAHTGIKYWALLGQVLDDLAVLVLSIAGWILFAEWKTMAAIGEGKLKLE